MYKAVIFSGALAFALTQVAFGQTQDNRYLVGSPSPNHSARIIQQQQSQIPAINTAYGNVAAPSAANAGAAYGSIGSGCDANVSGQAVGNAGGCDSRGGCGTAAGGCDAGPSCGGGCGTGGCGGGGGCDTGGCGLGQNFFAAGGCGNGGCSQEYWRTYAGWNDLDGLGIGVDARDGFAFGAAFGKRNNNIRTELDLTLRDNSIDSLFGTGTLRTTSAMANVLFDVNILQINNARSYIGAGIGAAYSDLEADSGLRADDTVFAYQFIAGMEKPLRNGAKAFAEYRYFSTTDYDFGGGPINFDNQNIFFGLEFNK